MEAFENMTWRESIWVTLCMLSILVVIVTTAGRLFMYETNRKLDRIIKMMDKQQQKSG